MLTFFQSQVALGSKIDLALVSDLGEDRINDYFRRLWLKIFEFEKFASRFLPDSELSQFNRAAGTKQIISPQFKLVLLAAERMSKFSDGLYNPFVLPALQRAGYVKSMVAAHSQDEVDDHSSRSLVTSDKLEIGDDWGMIPYGTAIDLGGCGKGYIGELLAGLADTFKGVKGYWFSLGGDIVAGGLGEDGKPWIVGIQKDKQPLGTLAGQVKLKDAARHAVATSSITARKGVKSGRAWHHIIDPRTGRPSKSDVVTATVCISSPLEADVLASCAVILGSKLSPEFLESKKVSGFLLQNKDGTIKSWGKPIILTQPKLNRRQPSL